MDISILLGKTLKEAKSLLEENFAGKKVLFVKTLSPKDDIIGDEERVIKTEEKDKLIIYYSLF